MRACIIRGREILLCTSNVGFLFQPQIVRVFYVQPKVLISRALVYSWIICNYIQQIYFISDDERLKIMDFLNKWRNSPQNTFSTSIHCHGKYNSQRHGYILPQNSKGKKLHEENVPFLGLFIISGDCDIIILGKC